MDDLQDQREEKINKEIMYHQLNIINSIKG